MNTIELLDNKLQAFGKEIQVFNGNIVKTEILSGNITQEVVKYLRKLKFDLIIMGLNGNGGMNTDLGRNTKSILEKSGLPILVLPNEDLQKSA